MLSYTATIMVARLQKQRYRLHHPIYQVLTSSHRSLRRSMQSHQIS